MTYDTRCVLHDNYSSLNDDHYDDDGLLSHAVSPTYTEVEYDLNMFNDYYSCQMYYYYKYTRTETYTMTYIRFRD